MKILIYNFFIDILFNWEYLSPFVTFIPSYPGISKSIIKLVCLDFFNSYMSDLHFGCFYPIKMFMIHYLFRLWNHF